MMNILSKKMAQFQEAVTNMGERLAEIEATGESGGGMVKVTATGSHRIKSIKIEQALLDTGDMEMLEDLLVAGLNQALEAASARAQEHTREALGSLTPAGFNADQLFK